MRNSFYFLLGAFLITLSIWFTILSCNQNSEYISCNPPKDSIPVDTVKVVEVIDSMPFVTHGNEMGVVEKSTTPPQIFQDNGVRENKSLVSPMAAAYVAPYPTKRILYLDRTSSRYKSATETAAICKYIRDNGFNEVHMYDVYNITGSSSNFPAFRTFCKALYNAGVVKRALVLGSYSTTGANNFWNSTSDTTQKFNGINYENEWWNGHTSWSTWINEFTTLNNYCDSKSPDLKCTFYMGWFKNMGSLTDSMVARQILQKADHVDLHFYQDGKVSATYGSSRLEGFAKAAKGLNMYPVINPIFSIEEKDWGAESDFQGYYLRDNGFKAMEKKWIDDFNLKATALQKERLRIGEFKYFLYRYCIRAVVPVPLAPQQ